MLADLDADEMADWEAFSHVELVGPDRLDFMLAQLTTVLANSNRDPKRKREPFQERDFMPYANREPVKRPLGERLLSMFKQLGGAHGK